MVSAWSDPDSRCLRRLFSPDLHDRRPQQGQRPKLHFLRQGQGSPDIGKIIGQRVKLKRIALAATTALVPGDLLVVGGSNWSTGTSG